jgi:UDP-N-acetylmuramate--alanine ligase
VGGGWVTISLADHHHVHFVGIGGIGMSALARLLLARGYRVSGSDQSPGEQGDALSRLGASVVPHHAPENVRGADLLVVSSAVPRDNPEIRAAEAARIPMVKRSELLASIMNPSKGIAIAGTHGKTTTSALVGHILTYAGRDPTILIGGVARNLGSNARLGASQLVVVEADEYDASFLRLRPSIAVITNIEPDHLDFYGTLQGIHAAFRRFAQGVRDTLIIDADDPALPGIVSGIGASVVDYGLREGAWRAEHIREHGGITHFRVRGGSKKAVYSTSLAGSHNVANCLAAIVVAHALGLTHDKIVPAVASFEGVARRFERKGEAGDVLVFDDYAHHPTEIRVNLAAMKSRFGRPLHVIFQPHTYSRTSALLEDFAESFAEARAVYLMDIYAARETDTMGVSGQRLADETARRHAHVSFTPTADATVSAVVKNVSPGDLVITMGAGDVHRLGPLILDRLRKR